MCNQGNCLTLRAINAMSRMQIRRDIINKWMGMCVIMVCSGSLRRSGGVCRHLREFNRGFIGACLFWVYKRPHSHVYGYLWRHLIDLTTYAAVMWCQAPAKPRGGNIASKLMGVNQKTEEKWKLPEMATTTKAEHIGKVICVEYLRNMTLLKCKKIPSDTFCLQCNRRFLTREKSCSKG